MNRRVSVIIPVYNREKYIEEAVKSVLAQSLKDFEIIIVDDGSTDSTVQICRRLSERDERIRLFSSGHFGVSAARNKGIENSSGDYIFFLDSDDIIHPLLLETLVNAIKKHGAEISGSGIVNIREENWEKAYRIIDSEREVGQTVQKSPEAALDEFFTRLTPINLIGGVMMKRSLISETRFNTDIYIGEDFLFIYENLVKKPTAVFLVPKWYYCRLHKGNSSWDFGYNGFCTRFKRRRIVWENEEKLGRTEYAARQKREVLSIYINCIMHGAKVFGDDSAKMRNILKEHRKAIFGGLGLKQRVLFIAVVYLPSSVIPYIKYINHKAKRRAAEK